QRKPCLLATGEDRSRLVRVIAGEQERSEYAARLGFGEFRRRRLHVLQHGTPQVERLVLLRVVADLESVPGLHLARVGFVETTEDAQQGRLARTVEAEYDHAAPPVDGEIDIGENLQRTVRLAELGRLQ